MPIQRVPLLRCECGESVVLPHQGSLDVAAVPLNQHSKWPLVFACAGCGKLSQYFAQDLCLEAIETPYPNPHSVVLWCAEFECVHKGCGRRFSIYTKHRPNGTGFEIARVIFSVQPRA